MTEKHNLTILIAPLDWGLGHATRCIPVINFLLSINCKVIIAAEKKQEILLKAEFPDVTFVNIPGYRIRYTNLKRLFSLNIALQIPKIISAIATEKKWLHSFLQNHSVDAIISDNRYGLHCSYIPSAFITHQLQIKAPFGLVEKILQKINFRLIEKFSYCWVPDEEGSVNMAGSLSHPKFSPNLPVAYIGGLSRLEKTLTKGNDSVILIILSGPEPQRTLLENVMLKELQQSIKKVRLIRGLPGNAAPLTSFNNVEIINHLTAKQLGEAFAESEFIISRSGYTTVMDICKTGKKSILIPTPGQTEQEYLAKHLQKQGWCMAVSQNNFSLENAITKASKFNYQLPDLNMEHYKEVLSNWVKNLQEEKNKNLEQQQSANQQF